MHTSSGILNEKQAGLWMGQDSSLQYSEEEVLRWFPVFFQLTSPQQWSSYSPHGRSDHYLTHLHGRTENIFHLLQYIPLLSLIST